MMREPLNWPKLVFIVAPLAIVIVDAAVLVRERHQPDAEKAIRLVKESNSRKENFTVQQYLYMTIHHRKNNGEQITIEGWRATTSPERGAPITVEFVYTDAAASHAAIWEADLKAGTVTPKNETSLDLSWH